MTDETLQQRVVRLGVKPAQVDDAVQHLEANAVSSHFHKFADDAEVATKLSKFTKPEQSDQTSQPDPFRTWLGKLAESFDKMQPVRKMMLHREYKELLLAKPSAVDTLHAELSVRHNGNLEGAHLTALEKLRIAHAVGATIKPKPAEKVAMTPAIQALPNAQMRVEAIRAIQRVAVLKSSERDFDQREVAQLRARFGAIIPD